MRGPRARRIAAALLACLACGCGPRQDDAPTFGLKTVRLHLDDDARAQVLHGGLDKSPVAAELRVGALRLGGRVRISGQGTIDQIKRSYRFDATDPGDPEQPRSFKISAQAQDNSFLRTLLGARAYAAAGIDVAHVEPVAFFIDSEFQGLYLLIERVDEQFYQRRGKRTERIYRSKLLRSSFGANMLEDPEAGLEAEQGSHHFPELRRLLSWAHASPSPEALRDVESTLDVPSFLRFFATQLYLLNCDGFNNNLYLYKTRDDPKLRFSPWDWEQIYGGNCDHESRIAANHLVRKAFQYPDLRHRIGIEVSELSRGVLPTETIRAWLDQDEATISEAYRADRFLGGLGISLRQRKESLLRLHEESVARLEALIPSRSPG